MLAVAATQWAHPPKKPAQSLPQIPLCGSKLRSCAIEHIKNIVQLRDKLRILADAAKYDASCSSSGGKKRDSLVTRGIGSNEGYLLRLPDQDAKDEQFARFVADLKKAKADAQRLTQAV